MKVEGKSLVFLSSFYTFSKEHLERKRNSETDPKNCPVHVGFNVMNYLFKYVLTWSQHWGFGKADCNIFTIPFGQYF